MGILPANNRGNSEDRIFMPLQLKFRDVDEHVQTQTVNISQTINSLFSNAEDIS